MVQNNFKRVEKKYLLTAEQYEKLLPVLKSHMIPDRYSNYTISNIYFDTEDFLLIRESLNKPDYKEKLRLRAYGVPEEDTVVFAELKKKYKGVVYKRRIELTMAEARKYFYKGEYPETDSQILREIDYTKNHLDLKARVYIAYEREAYSGSECSDLRVTFDRNIRGRDIRLDLTEGDSGRRLLDENEILMEVKIPGAVPMWMAGIFSELSVYMTSYSKYGEYYQRYLAEEVGRSARLYQFRQLQKGAVKYA